MSFNISSTAVSANIYNTQTSNQVATVNSSNLANNAANQSAFSSYIGQAFAQIGVANPTNFSAPVVSGANKTSAKEQESQKSVSTFIQDLFSILSKKNPLPTKNTVVYQQTNSPLISIKNDEQNESLQENSEINETAIAAYNAENSTTVGNIVANLQTLIKQLNDTNRNTTTSNNSDAIETLQNGFKNILDAIGAAPDNKIQLGSFLQTLAQNLQGQSPLGIIINTEA